MPKIVDAKPTIAKRIVERHKQAVAESRTGKQAEAWIWLDKALTYMAEVFRISGQILRFFTTRMLFSALRATKAGIATFFREMGRGL